MKIVDLLQLCPFEKVEEKLVLYYGNENIEEYLKLYYDLSNRTLKNYTENELYIYITVRKETDDGTDPAVETFDENDSSVYFDVSGIEPGSEVLQSIASIPFDDFLQCSIDESTLEKFPYESILAHTLWEVTSFSFEDKA